MINGVKINMVYHLYFKNVQDIEDNIYHKINHSCLTHFHGIFDTAVFCVCLDEYQNKELIKKSIDWIFSCGFKDGTTIKFKKNSPYRDAQTFYNEVADCLSDIDGIVFFGHNKGTTFSELNGLKQWIIYSYFSCLDKIEEHVNNLTDAVCAYTYVPSVSKDNLPFSQYYWNAPGGIFLFNPRKFANYLFVTGKKKPLLTDRFSAEMFIPKIVDIRKYVLMDIMFDSVRNTYFESENFIDFYNLDHNELISYFLPPERVKEYKEFYNMITNNISN